MGSYKSRFLKFRSNSKYKSNRLIQQERSLQTSPQELDTVTSDSQLSAKETIIMSSIASKLYLTIKDRNGRNNLIDAYVSRLKRIIGDNSKTSKSKDSVSLDI